MKITFGSPENFEVLCGRVQCFFVLVSTTDNRTCWTSKNSGNEKYLYVQDFGLVTRLAGTNLFRRENSYGVAREGKLHCKEEGKLRIVCQVGGKTPNCRDKWGKVYSSRQEEEKLPIVLWRENFKLFVKWRENSKWFGQVEGKLQNFREEGKLLLLCGGTTKDLDQ